MEGLRRIAAVLCLALPLLLTGHEAAARGSGGGGGGQDGKSDRGGERSRDRDGGSSAKGRDGGKAAREASGKGRRDGTAPAAAEAKPGGRDKRHSGGGGGSLAKDCCKDARASARSGDAAPRPRSGSSQASIIVPDRVQAGAWTRAGVRDPDTSAEAEAAAAAQSDVAAHARVATRTIAVANGKYEATIAVSTAFARSFTEKARARDLSRPFAGAPRPKELLADARERVARYFRTRGEEPMAWSLATAFTRENPRAISATAVSVSVAAARIDRLPDETPPEVVPEAVEPDAAEGGLVADGGAGGDGVADPILVGATPDEQKPAAIVADPQAAGEPAPAS